MAVETIVVDNGEEAVTKRVLDANETAVEIAQIQADRDVTIAETQAETAEAIAEAQSGELEWRRQMESELSQTRTQLSEMTQSVATLAEAATTMAVQLQETQALILPLLPEPLSLNLETNIPGTEPETSGEIKTEAPANVEEENPTPAPKRRAGRQFL